ncbi:AbrB/MazE/SpoVT family DNA-binding domain-containing protein [Chryseobacterium sp. CBSDS_008]|uniref:AbrB/MazE/SpoVT family DNA-binding domain-containing protein n=1 Tax=Chryseobacterium sp. CBSDS_008 TaxID=3415265 RepID=UPI003CFAD851
MKTKVRKIGNSFGIIIGRKILDQVAVDKEVSLTVEDSKIIIEAVKSNNPREHWEEMLLKANSLEDQELLEDFENEFDKSEWTW